MIAPLHDNLTGKNIFNTKGAIHYITETEINQAKSYLNNRIDSNKARSSLKLLEAKNRHLEAYTAKLKGSLSEMNSQFQISKKESHKYKLQIKLLEQQIKNLIKRSA